MSIRRIAHFAPETKVTPTPRLPRLRRAGWVARSFANRCPIVALEEPPRPFHDGILGGIGGFGVHEVLVESPEHAPLHHQGQHRTETALQLAVLRLRDLAQDRRLLTLTWFRNHGPASGGESAPSSCPDRRDAGYPRAMAPHCGPGLASSSGDRTPDPSNPADG